jgi:hypothetical protein
LCVSNKSFPPATFFLATLRSLRAASADQHFPEGCLAGLISRTSEWRHRVTASKMVVQEPVEPPGCRVPAGHALKFNGRLPEQILLHEISPNRMQNSGW